MGVISQIYKTVSWEKRGWLSRRGAVANSLAQETELTSSLQTQKYPHLTTTFLRPQYRAGSAFRIGGSAAHTCPSGLLSMFRILLCKPTNGFCPKELKSESQRGLSTPVFIMASLTTVRMWNDLNVQQQMNRWRCDRDMHRNTIQTQKRNSAKWDNTSEAWGHCAQWISQSEKHLGSTYMRGLKWKSQIPMVSKSRMLVTRDWKQGEREVTDGQAGSFSQVRRTNSRVCCTTVNSHGL